MPQAPRRGLALAALLLTLGGTAACGNNPTVGSGDAGGVAGDRAGHTSAPVAALLTRATFASAMTDAIQHKRSAHLHLSIGSMVDARGDVAYDGSTPAMHLTMTFAGRKAELRFVGGTAYLAMPGLVPRGKFLAVEPSDAMMGSLVKQLKSFGPDGAVSMLKGAVKDFQDAGATTIDGQQVRHYKVTVDPAAMVASMKLPASISTGSVPTSVTEDLYVGAGNLMRRVVLHAADQKVIIDATKWGEPVHVTAPAPSRVVKRASGFGALAG